MKSLTLFLILFCCTCATAQPITGVWKGKMGKQRAEVKLVQNGDNITGTSYYYDAANNYRRYSIKGYFDAANNNVVWWDDALIEENTGKLSLSAPGTIFMHTSADFNCPGGDEMLLDGTTHPQGKEEKTDPVHLEKIQDYPTFRDEWDYVIYNYTLGTNDPEIIDSVEGIAKKPAPKKTEKKMVEEPPVIENRNTGIVLIPMPAPEIKPNLDSLQSIAIAEKFTTRKKVFVTEVPLEGDSIELRFYDNAEIDGDSISLFLNDRLLFQHVRLAASAYSIKLPVHELNDNNELVMVAENLGTIPPNTSYMVAVVNGKRYEARLASTENSSAFIRLTKSAVVPANPSQ